LACLVGTAFRVHAGPADVPATLADCARSVLKSAGGTGEDVWALAADLTDAQHAGLTEAIGDRPLRIGLAGVLGDTGAASAALQVAAVLALADADPAARGRLALVASVDRDGSAGVAAFRLPGRRQGWHG
jgi:3-oxoacyl-[acyl-carrier-protein] synthase II